MAIPIKPGDIILINNWAGGFLSSAIRFFTKSWSHSAIGFYRLASNVLPPIQTIFEASTTVHVTDWARVYNDENLDLRVYRWTKPMPVEPILQKVFESYNGNTYGIFQVLWFVWRWVIEKLHLPKRWARKNFFPNHEICSEVVYVGLKELNNPIVNIALAKLNRDQNTVHVGDIMFICDELVKMGILEQVYNRQRI